MKKQRPVWIVILLCSFAIGLGSCQNFPNPFEPAAPPPLLPAADVTDKNGNDALRLNVNDDALRLNVLEADNASLNKKLADAMKDNARLKKELTDAKEDNSILKDLAAKKER